MRIVDHLVGLTLAGTCSLSAASIDQTSGSICPFRKDELEFFDVHDARVEQHSSARLALPKALGAYLGKRPPLLVINAWKREDANRYMTLVLGDKASTAFSSAPSISANQKHFALTVQISLYRRNETPRIRAISSFRNTTLRDVPGLSSDGIAVQVTKETYGQIGGVAYADIGLKATFFTSANFVHEVPGVQPELVASYVAHLLSISHFCGSVK